MSDTSKSKITSRSSSCSSNNGGMSSIGSQTISSRAGLQAQVTASVSPVSSAKEACSLPEKKGWKLSSKPYSKNKLTDIFFSAALVFEILAEANTAIHAVAYLVHKQAEEELTTQIADKVIDKISDNLKEQIIKLADSVSTTKSFLDATSQKQVAKLLSLQESVKQQCDNAKLIADSLAKLSAAQAMGNLIAWPTLTSANPTSPQLIHLASLFHSCTVSQANLKVLHHIALASKQLLIEYGMLEQMKHPRKEPSKPNKSCIKPLMTG
jgi:hypothetical protein